MTKQVWRVLVKTEGDDEDLELCANEFFVDEGVLTIIEDNRPIVFFAHGVWKSAFHSHDVEEVLDNAEQAE